MFYSHEILTSRKHGVATIWLVATLGSKSTLKKVNRRDINEVNVPRACEIIVSPGIPMALRLQSHLLYGVSRVYHQQCSYVLTDAQAAQQTIIQAFRKMASSVLDPDAGKIRPELLLIPDDPSFVPDLALGAPYLTPELPDLEFSQSTLTSSQTSSLQYQQDSDQSSYAAGAGIQIPASDSEIPGLGRFGTLPADLDTSSANRSRATLGNLLDDFYNDLTFSPTADFGFDAEGNLYDFDNQGGPATDQHGNTTVAQFDNNNNIAAMEQAMQEHELARQAADQPGGYYLDDQDAYPLGEQDEMQLDVEPFPPRAPYEPAAAHAELLDPDYDPEHEEAVAEEASEESATAPLTRRARARRAIPADTDTQIRTSTFAEWNRNYVQTMLKASMQKAQKSVPALAKRNAEYWVWTSGLGNLRSNAFVPEGDDPFSKFSGDILLKRVTGVDLSATLSKKRPRNELNEGHDQDQDLERNQTRRVRSQSPARRDMEEARGDIDTTNSPADVSPLGDEDIEVGREAPTPLAGDPSQDLSALMPWNLSVSRHSSHRQTSRPFTSAGGSFGSGVSFLTGLGRRRGAGRLTSASPLLGRGGGLSGLAGPSGVDSSSADGEHGGIEFDAEREDEPDGAHGMAGTLAGEDSDWSEGGQRGASQLDRESRNFLDFVRAALVNEKDGQAEEEAAGVLFETLLPPTENSKIVAAQGLMHVLALGTKGLLHVVQKEAFGGISLLPVD